MVLVEMKKVEVMVGVIMELVLMDGDGVEE